MASKKPVVSTPSNQKKANPVKVPTASSAKAKAAAAAKAKAANAAKTAWQADPTYQASRGAMKSQLEQYGTNLASQANRFDQAYGEDLGNLGLQYENGARYTTPDNGAFTWKDSIAKTGDSFAGHLTTPKQAAAASYWNQIDPLTSSGKAFTDQTNDYAARGMLQSTGYLTDHANLNQSFQNQLHDAQLSRNNQLSDYNSQAQAEVGNVSGTLNQARLNAINNYNTQQQTNAVRAAAGIKN